MKTFIIHIKNIELSRQTANIAKDSCIEFGYEPELVSGITPDTVLEFDKEYGLTVLKPSHMHDRQIGKNGSSHTYLCKYSNFLNHYRSWLECIKLNETIIVLEHDVICLREWDNPKFDGLLLLNAKAGLSDPQLNHHKKIEYVEGIHKYRHKSLVYRSENIWKGAAIIPGSAAYAITPAGAKSLVNNVREHGWDKADYIINSHTVDIDYASPDYFSFSHHIVANQRTSHGIN